MHFGLADASVWLVLIAVRLQLCNCSKYTCTIGTDGFCIFQGVHIESPEQAASVQLEPPAAPTADVTRVKFRDSSMYMLPPGLYGAFRHLEELRVWWMHLHSIHIDPRLLTLDAEKNRISSITTDPGTVPLLQKLELNQNRLRNIDNISVFENLEVLQVAHNDLRTLDLCVFQRMAKLRLLDLSSNNLALVRSSIGPEKLTSLTVLYLNDNRLTYLDLGVLRSFPALEKVNLANNALVYVDHDALPTMLPRLRVFYIQSNDWHCEGLTELVGQLRKTGAQDFKLFSAFICKERTVEGVCCTENKPFALVRKSNQYLASYTTELNGHTRHLMRELQHTRHEVARLIANDNYTQVSLQNIGDEVEELRNQLTEALAAPDPVTGRPEKPTAATRTLPDGSVNPERLVSEVSKLRRGLQKMADEHKTLRQEYDKLQKELEALRTDTNQTKLSFELMKEENALLRQNLRQLEQKLQQLFSRGANV
ncbi:uncharacterized protein LOC128714877 [Anopheles marshallii]|uniref:uncharacterized protein LOC128714877 n=1 Tax=Anopheles marshallii TaxID=1521116 RepID=UPI00237BA010|nr:uncharacterized protein LOC128714877 [Anopheles marshallii]